MIIAGYSIQTYFDFFRKNYNHRETIKEPFGAFVFKQITQAIDLNLLENKGISAFDFAKIAETDPKTFHQKAELLKSSVLKQEKT